MTDIICSHGLGVRPGTANIFTGLAVAFPALHFVGCDYNQTQPGGDVLLATLDDQAARLQDCIDSQPAGSILLCHSQGCITAGLADLSRVKAVILLAPPDMPSMQRVADGLVGSPQADINPDGLSRLPRTDGGSTLVPADYLPGLLRDDPISLYTKMAATLPTYIIKATDDELLGDTIVDGVAGANIVRIAANHGFSGNGQPKLIASLTHIFDKL